MEKSKGNIDVALMAYNRGFENANPKRAKRNKYVKNVKAYAYLIRKEMSIIASQKVSLMRH
jgi:hypothetical protein